MFLLILWFLLPLTLADAADKIRLAVPDVGGQFITFPLAQKLGLLKQEGIDGEIVLIRGNAALAALTSGDIDYTVGIPQGIRGALAGLPLKIVACFEPSSTLLLLSHARVKTLSDLAGKTIAVGAVNGAPTRIARMILQQAKLNPDKEIKFLSVGAAQARLALMKQGLADGAMVPPPFDVEGKKLGYIVLARTHELLSFPQSGLAIHAKRLKDKPDEIKRMIKAGIKANGYIRSNRDGTIKFLMEWQRAGAEIAAATYDSIWRVYNADGGIPMDGLGLVVQDTKELLELKQATLVSDFVDLSALRAAQTELGIKFK
ncbi:MAG: ABC transporter substrate-binding protein [Deltaproteobacteria bacterium]|nr:ABC transporter substrate-binding protein [Deltaproteobacteria bacterium]